MKIRSQKQKWERLNKNQRYGKNACDDATNRPVSLNNEANPDVAVFSGAAPPPHCRLRLHHCTKPLSTVSMKKMYNKDTIDTTPATNAPTAAPADASTWFPVLIVSNYPYSLRNHNIPTSSIGTKKTQKIPKDKWRQS